MANVPRRDKQDMFSGAVVRVPGFVLEALFKLVAHINQLTGEPEALKMASSIQNIL